MGSYFLGLGPMRSLPSWRPPNNSVAIPVPGLDQLLGAFLLFFRSLSASVAGELDVLTDLQMFLTHGVEKVTATKHKTNRGSFGM